jgi:hypothetical protein
MLVSRMIGRRFANEKRTIWNRTQYALFLCGFPGIASALLVPNGTMAILNAIVSDPDPASPESSLDATGNKS